MKILMGYDIITTNKGFYISRLYKFQNTAPQKKMVMFLNENQPIFLTGIIDNFSNECLIKRKYKV